MSRQLGEKSETIYSMQAQKTGKTTYATMLVVTTHDNLNINIKSHELRIATCKLKML